MVGTACPPSLPHKKFNQMVEVSGVEPLSETVTDIPNYECSLCLILIESSPKDRRLFNDLDLYFNPTIGLSATVERVGISRNQ